jgi:hypothetical protein
VQNTDDFDAVVIEAIAKNIGMDEHGPEPRQKVVASSPQRRMFRGLLCRGGDSADHAVRHVA